MGLRGGAQPPSAGDMDPRASSLAQISYLVANLNKKNYKSSVSEIQQVCKVIELGIGFGRQGIEVFLINAISVACRKVRWARRFSFFTVSIHARRLQR